MAAGTKRLIWGDTLCVCSFTKSFRSKFGGNQEINRGEAFACLSALVRNRYSSPITIHIDSKNTIEGVLKLVLNPTSAKTLWNKMSNFSILRTCAYIITERRRDESLGNTHLNKVKSHTCSMDTATRPVDLTEKPITKPNLR